MKSNMVILRITLGILSHLFLVKPLGTPSVVNIGMVIAR